jgi:integrase
MREKITLETLRRLKKIPPAAVQDIYDVAQPGLVLRVRPNGKYTYRALLSRGRWHTLGGSELTPDKARELTRGVRGEVSTAKALGQADPIAARRGVKKQITFATFVLEHYEPWATAQRKTGGEQTIRLRQTFGSTLNDLRLDEISPFHVERWRSARLKDGIAASTVNRDLSTLRGALSRAVEWNLLAAHPLAKVKASKIDRRANVRYLAPEEVTRLSRALEARDDARRMERERANAWRRERGYAEWPALGTYTDHITPIVRLALQTGLRRGELFQLRWSDVDLDAARLIVRGDGTKTGQTRHVPLNASAGAILTTWRASVPAETPEALVFPSANGEPLVDIKKAWAALMKAARINGFRFHDCRHDFASQLVMAGVDLNTVRELLGHSDIKMVLRYAHLAPEHTAAAVAKLAAR